MKKIYNKQINREEEVYTTSSTIWKVIIITKNKLFKDLCKVSYTYVYVKIILIV